MNPDHHILHQPGDSATWMLPGNLPHIGVVVDGFSPDGERPLMAWIQYHRK